MNLFQRLGASIGAAVYGYGQARDGNPLNNPAVPLGGPGFWAWLFSGELTESGENINDFTALQHITVYVCVRIIAQSIASLPVKVKEMTDAGRKEAIDHDLYGLLRYQPNPEMTAFSFFEALTGSAALTGNCYAQITKNAAGKVARLDPLHPHKTKPVRLKDGNIAYKTTDGEKMGESRYLPPEAVLHIPLFSFDGLLGLSPVQQAKQTIGLGRAAEKFGARFFGNGSTPGGVLSPADGSKPDEKTISQVKDSWQAMQAGINQGRTAVIPGNWKYQQISLRPEESQFLESRKYTRTDICALFNVPPHMAGDTTRLSNSNHEQQSLQFVTDTLRPYVVRWEQELARKLLPTTGRNSGRYEIEFDLRERLRGDFATTMQGYALGRQWGFFSANDVRRDMGENPIGGAGDVYYAPVNMQNLDNLLPENGGGKPAAKPEPGAMAKPGDKPEEQEGRQARRFALAYIAMFRDGVARVCRRSSRDLGSISDVFKPALLSLAEQIRDVYAAKLGLLDGWNESSAVVSDYLPGLHKRAAGWDANDTDQVAMAELKRAFKALHIETARRAGEAAALAAE